MRESMIAALSPLVGDVFARLLIPGWFAMTAIAAVVSVWWLLRRARAADVDTQAVLSTAALTYVVAVAAGIVLPLAWDLILQVAAGRTPRLRWAGMTSYCGFAAGALTIFLCLRKHESLSPLRFADLAAPCAGLALLLVRLGCFSAGCDYGQVSASPLAVRFPAGSPAFSHQVRAGWVPEHATQSLAVHPAQLYEAALGLLLCLLALAVAKTAWSRRREGRVILSVAVAYALGRFAIEAVRGDAARGFAFGMSNAQLAAVAFGLLIAGRSIANRISGRRAIAACAALLLLTPAARGEAESDWEIGGYLGGASAVNRRDGQVPALSGGAVAGSYGLSSRFRLGVDLGSMANSVAVHGSALATADMRVRVHPRVDLGPRAGIGVALINFESEAFADQWASAGRLGFGVHFQLSERWLVSARPLELDVVTSRAIGGPIVTVQAYLGAAVRL